LVRVLHKVVAKKNRNILRRYLEPQQLCCHHSSTEASTASPTHDRLGLPPRFSPLFEPPHETAEVTVLLHHACRNCGKAPARLAPVAYMLPRAAAVASRSQSFRGLPPVPVSAPFCGAPLWPRTISSQLR
jgi:hypothetical protein